ncbi:unnamed protein product [Pylaiella littoralis]
MSSANGSSEEANLLGNGGGSGNSLDQPFMATYNGGSANPRGGTEDTATAPQRPPTTPDLENLEKARQAVISSQMEVPDDPTMYLSRRWILIKCLAAVFAYLCLGVIAYTSLAGMDFVDALYFCVVTLTTVGYGDVSAHKPSTKLFACFYILIGVAIVASFLAQLVELLLDEEEHLLLKLLKDSRASAMGIHRASPPSAKKTVSSVSMLSLLRATCLVYVCGLARCCVRQVELVSGIAFFLLLVGAGTVVFKMSGHISFIDAFYLTIVSSSTVGYGDYYPTTTGTRLFAIFFLPLSTLVLGKVIATYTEMKANERTKKKQTRILLATITANEYATMDTNGDNRVSPLEFLCSTLLRQEKVTQEEITEIHNRFAALDKDHNGFITQDEVGAYRDLDGDGFIEPDEL